MRLRNRLAVPGLLVLAALVLGGSGAGAVSARTFAWIAVGDHFEEPAPGLVSRMVEAKPAFVVGLGDLVFRSSPDDFAKFRKVILEPLQAIGARFYPVAGNHDFPVRPHWFEFWEPPANRLHYSFDYGDAHFVVLDTNKAEAPAERAFPSESEAHAIRLQGEDFTPGSAQYEWLRKDLAATKQAFVFVFFHVPAFSHGGHDGSIALQRTLCPLFERYHVTAVFMGHSHGYERFVPLRVDLSSGQPVAVPDAARGVTYVVTAGGGMPLYDITRNPLHAALAREFHFVRVDMHADRADCTAVEAKSGRVLDSFVLKRRE